MHGPEDIKRGRGRPSLKDAADEKVLRQRRQAAERTRKCRERRKAALRKRDITSHSQGAFDAAQALLEPKSSVGNGLQSRQVGESRLELEMPVDRSGITRQGEESSDSEYCQSTDKTQGQYLYHTSSILPPAEPTRSPSASPEPALSPREETNPKSFADETPVTRDFMDGQEETGMERSQVHNTGSSKGQFAGMQGLGPSSIDEESDDLPHACGISELSSHDYTLGKLYAQILDGFHGCSREDHLKTTREHLDQEGDNHFGLDEIFNDPTFPSVLGTPELAHLACSTQPNTPSASQWQTTFCGLASSQDHRRHSGVPMNVCLHKEMAGATESHVAFDVDSYLGFASSLAVARKGLWYHPAPQRQQNMTADVHVETKWFRGRRNGEQSSRPSLALPRDVPHLFLGSLMGSVNTTLHVLFPHLPFAGEKFVCLTNNQLSQWLDRIFHPAVYQHYESHYTQHLPTSYRHALANSRARQSEGRQVKTRSYLTQQYIGFCLQPQHLGRIWTDVLSRIAVAPDLAGFREPELFISAKGTKLEFKTNASRGDVLNTLLDSRSSIAEVIDLDFVARDRFYVDVGKEICSRSSSLPHPGDREGNEAQVYCWKRCCLQHYMDWMYEGQPPAIGGRGQQYYSQNMLYEASGLTSITPKRSKLRQGGLIYSQFYNSVKEISDAAKCYPFENEVLEELALDLQLQQGARNLARNNRKDMQVLMDAYCNNKRRVRDALLASEHKSFGIREEHRIGWTLFESLIARLQDQNGNRKNILLSSCPTYAWPVETQVFLGFLWRSVDKFATGFEVVRARCHKDLVTWEETKMMAMFLRCLRFVLASPPVRRESALWWSRHEHSVNQPSEQRVSYGLGFCNTLPRHKYCWLEPRFDWNRLAFLSDVTDQVLFGVGTLRWQYTQRGGKVKDFFGATRQLDLASEWIEKHGENVLIVDRLITWMVHICLRQFRVDVIDTVKKELMDEHQDHALQGNEPFCYEYLRKIRGGKLHFVAGNRSSLKDASKLADLLFEFDDGELRSHWDHRPFRKLYRRAHTILKARSQSLSPEKIFAHQLRRKLFTHHWVLPYPNSQVLMQKTKKRSPYVVLSPEKSGNRRRIGRQDST